jgi:hypothetical protein
MLVLFSKKCISTKSDLYVGKNYPCCNVKCSLFHISCVCVDKKKIKPIGLYLKKKLVSKLSLQNGGEKYNTTLWIIIYFSDFDSHSLNISILVLQSCNN